MKNKLTERIEMVIAVCIVVLCIALGSYGIVLFAILAWLENRKTKKQKAQKPAEADKQKFIL